jgi:hypothetical protein
VPGLRDLIHGLSREAAFPSGPPLPRRHFRGLCAMGQGLYKNERSHTMHRSTPNLRLALLIGFFVSAAIGLTLAAAAGAQGSRLRIWRSSRTLRALRTRRLETRLRSRSSPRTTATTPRTST